MQINAHHRMCIIISVAESINRWLPFGRAIVCIEHGQTLQIMITQELKQEEILRLVEEDQPQAQVTTCEFCHFWVGCGKNT